MKQVYWHQFWIENDTQQHSFEFITNNINELDPDTDHYEIYELLVDSGLIEEGDDVAIKLEVLQVQEGY